MRSHLWQKETTLICEQLDSGAHLALLVLETLQHILWHSKLVRIPGEVALAVRVLDVQPDEVIGNVVLVKAGVDRLHVLLVVVVPPALVVTQCIDGREGLSA